MHGIRIRSYCIYHMQIWRGIFQRDLVKFRFAVVVIDATLLSQDDHLYIMSLIEQYVCSYMYVAGSA